jgi:hypothetical protein
MCTGDLRNPFYSNSRLQKCIKFVPFPEGKRLSAHPGYLSVLADVVITQDESYLYNPLKRVWIRIELTID